jgi:hypothetical protein
VDSAVVVGVDCAGFGVASGPGIVDIGKILGVEVAVVAKVAVGVDCLGSATGSIPGVDTWRIFGVEVATVVTVVVRADRTGGSKTVFSMPKIETMITIREAPVINLRFSIRSRLQQTPSVGANGTGKRALPPTWFVYSVRT